MNMCDAFRSQWRERAHRFWAWHFPGLQALVLIIWSTSKPREASPSFPVGTVWAEGRKWMLWGPACLESTRRLAFTSKAQSWESSSLPESCVGPSLPVVPGILTSHFILTLLPISGAPWTWVTEWLCLAAVMRALRLKEGRRPLLTAPLTLLLSVSFFVFLPLPPSVCLSVSACVCIFVCLCLTLVCLSLLISQFLSMDFILNSFSVSPLFFDHTPQPVGS